MRVTPAAEQFLQLPQAGLRQRARRRPHGLGEMRDHRGVDRVGLGQLADRFGELADLARVDDRHREAGLRQGHRDQAFVAAAGLHDDQNRRQRHKPPDQLAQPFAIAAAAERGTVGPDMHIHPRLRHVDADNAFGNRLAFHNPASSMRARAQTTVRACGKPAGATCSRAVSKTWTHPGCRLGSASQATPGYQTTPR